MEERNVGKKDVGMKLRTVGEARVMCEKKERELDKAKREGCLSLSVWIKALSLALNCSRTKLNFEQQERK